VLHNVNRRQPYPRVGLLGDVDHARLGGAGELGGVSVACVSKYKGPGVVVWFSLLSLSGRLSLVAVDEDVFALLLDGLVELRLAVELDVLGHDVEMCELEIEDGVMLDVIEMNKRCQERSLF
jgi:hypothetical protein